MKTFSTREAGTPVISALIGLALGLTNLLVFGASSAGVDIRIENPYENVEWETVTMHKTTIHEHYRGYGNEPADTLDVLADGAKLGGESLSEDQYYTILGISSQAEDEAAYWGTNQGGWTDMADVRGYSQNRDPTKLGVEGVLSFPVQEIDDVEHFNYLFSTASPQDFDYYPGPNPGNIDHFIEAVREALNEDRGLVRDDLSTQVVIAHGSRYWDSVEDGKTRYHPLFDEYTHKNGLLGLEIFGKFLNQQGDHYGDGFDLNDYFEVWDDLNRRYMPERPIWGFAAGDANHGRWGSGSGPDLQFMLMPLSGDEFDPSNWYDRMSLLHEKFENGRFFSAMRNPGDWNSPDNAPEIPVIESISVDYEEKSITIDIDWPDEKGSIDWYSSQGIVETGSKIKIGSQHAPFIRAHAYTPDGDGHIITQPFGIVAK